MNNEINTKLVELAIDQGTYPEKLYKYRTTEQVKLILDNYSFWFALPDSFNDPFDCNLSENENPTIDDFIIHLNRLGMAEKVIQKTIDSFSDKPEVISNLVKDAKENSIKKKGVLSLSRDPDDILMWSHYCDSHQGIVLGIELRKDLEFFLMPISVVYQDNYDPINYLKDPSKSTIDTLKIKSSQWEYENEVRIYKGSSKLYPINKSAFSDIFFGVNTPQEKINEIMDICKQKKLSNIKFHQAKKVHGKFELYFVEI